MDSYLQICLVIGGKAGQDVHHAEEPGHLSQGHLPLSFFAGCDEVLEPYTEDPASDKSGGEARPFPIAGCFSEIVMASIFFLLKITDNMSFLVFKLIQFLRFYYSRIGFFICSFTKSKKISVCTPLSTVFLLNKNSVLYKLDGWILGDMEPGAQVAMLVAVHLAHHHTLAS